MLFFAEGGQCESSPKLIDPLTLLVAAAIVPSILFKMLELVLNTLLAWSLSLAPFLIRRLRRSLPFWLVLGSVRRAGVCHVVS